AEEWHDPGVRGRTLAFLQYTSGSTGAPRGVMVTHGNLLHNSAYLDRGFGHSPESVSLCWLPTFHDMGLVWGIIQPLYTGLPCYLTSPASFLTRPARWLQAVSRSRVTHSGGPNFAYDLCVRKVTPGQRDALDLSSWSVALNGAEPVREETLARFAEFFEPCGFRRNAFCPGYGLAESTLKVTSNPMGEEPASCTVLAAGLEQNRVVVVPRHGADSATFVACGRAGLRARVVIVDPATRAACPPDRVGEIWVAGPSVAQGYWRRPDETRHTFRAHLSDTGEGPFLRTGDLGFMR